MIITKNTEIFKMKITLNEKLIKKDEKYSLSDIQNTIMKAGESVGINYSDGLYVCKNYESVMALLGSIMSKKWLSKYVKEWVLIYNDGTEEDLLVE